MCDLQPVHASGSVPSRSSYQFIRRVMNITNARTLASIRTAAEMMADSDSEAERRRFVDLMIRDVGRLELAE
jgi:hypothetical protein